MLSTKSLLRNDYKSLNRNMPNYNLFHVNYYLKVFHNIQQKSKKSVIDEHFQDITSVLNVIKRHTY